jgi:hypothetical protein
VVSNSAQKAWTDIAMSADGRIQSATNLSGTDGYIYVSTDYGKTWFITASLQKNWRTIAMSSDGKVQTAAYMTFMGGGGYIYTSNADSYQYGKVGIGTSTPQASLDVTGEVKIGNTGLGCSAATEGAIRYNPSNKIMNFCDGTAWWGMATTTP